MQVWGEELFAFVFGDDWKTAGSMASILVYAVAVRFIVSPLSSVLAIKQHMFKGFCWQLLYFITCFHSNLGFIQTIRRFSLFLCSP